MKTIKIFFAAALVLVGMSVSAQWTNGTGNDIYKTTTGNVGIGISSPIQDLHVVDPSGAANARLERDYTGTTGINGIGAYQIRNIGNGDMAYFGLRKNGTSSDFVQSVYDGTAGAWRQFTYFHFGTRKYEVQNGVNDVEFTNTGDVFFNNGGGIAIGTTTMPTGAMLAVNGKILATEVEVALKSSWPDYVFDEDYKLSPLSEVEKFIKENGHLPGIPSAQEVKDNGLSLGEMNKNLMEKVEELTLYVIQLQKEVNSLKTK